MMHTEASNVAAINPRHADHNGGKDAFVSCELQGALIPSDKTRHENSIVKVTLNGSLTHLREIEPVRCSTLCCHLTQDNGRPAPALTLQGRQWYVDVAEEKSDVCSSR